MTVECDACETTLSEGVSDCCGTDVWGEYRADGDRHICEECGNDCNVINIEPIKLEIFELIIEGIGEPIIHQYFKTEERAKERLSEYEEQLGHNIYEGEYEINKIIVHD